MANPLPKWLMRRYAVLWAKLKDKKFSYEKAQKILKDKNTVLSVVLSELKKAGWLSVDLNPKDARKRVYKLKSLDKAFKELAKVKK